jgi:hypothetical protein
MRTSAIGWMVGCLVTALHTVTVVNVFAQAAAQSTAPLPPAVQRAFQQSYPGATISAAVQERDRDRSVFRVDSVDKGRRRVVLYDAGGTAIEIAEQVDEKDLPRPVADAMHSHPRAIYVSGMKVTRGRDVEYRLTLRGTRKAAMVAKPDGTVVSFK